MALRPAAAAAATAAVGTVTALRPSEICVTFEEMPEEAQLAEPLTLSLLYNDVTFRRLEAAVATLRSDAPPLASAGLVRALLSDSSSGAMAAAAAAGHAAEALPPERIMFKPLRTP